MGSVGSKATVVGNGNETSLNIALAEAGESNNGDEEIRVADMGSAAQNNHRMLRENGFDSVPSYDESLAGKNAIILDSYIVGTSRREVLVPVRVVSVSDKKLPGVPAVKLNEYINLNTQEPYQPADGNASIYVKQSGERESFVVNVPQDLAEAQMNYKAIRISKHMPKERQAELRRQKAEYRRQIDELRKKYRS